MVQGAQSVAFFDWLPGYVVKYGPATIAPENNTIHSDRIDGHYNARKALIENPHLSHLKVPVKYYYQNADGLGFVISKQVTSDRAITAQQGKELVEFILE